MVKDLLKKFNDYIFGISRIKRNFITTNPNETILVYNVSKGIVTDHQDMDSGLAWVTSQKAILILTNKRLKCGTWDILLYRVLSAKMNKVNSFFGTKHILEIQTKDNNLRFEMQYNSDWMKQKALKLTFVDEKITQTIHLIPEKTEGTNQRQKMAAV